MAHHKSAIKRIKTSEKSRLRNKARKNTLRNMMRKLEKAQGDDFAKAAKDIVSLADREARKGLIHKNRAAHLKARVQKKVASLAKK